LNMSRMTLFDLIESEQWYTIRRGLVDGADSTLKAESIYCLNLDGMTPVHAAVSNPRVPQDIVIQLVNLNEKALLTESKSQSIPLHYACESGSVDTVRTLLQLAYIETPPQQSLQYYITYLDINERTPLERAWLTYLTSTKVIDGESYCSDRFPNELLDLWTKTEFILYASNKQKVDFSNRHHVSNRWYVLHEIARSGRECWCPNVVMWFALKLGFHYQLRMYDENGDLPLHVAARSPVHKILFIPRANKFSPFMNKSVLDILIKSYPEACQIRNKQNYLPLQLAIIKRGKKDWDGINALLKAYPNGVNAVDTNTRLHPFHLSASSQHGSDNDNELRQKKHSSLELTFRLLRRNPILIQECTSNKRKRSSEEGVVFFEGGAPKEKIKFLKKRKS
jgi:ankyrin repeat protein